MSDLQTRYNELEAAGRLPVYCYKNAPVEEAKANNVQVRLGEQPNGRFLHLLDLDSHTPEQNAHAAKQALDAALPHVTKHIAWHPSYSGTGWHGLVECFRRMPDGPIYDSDGNHLGELLSRDDQHTYIPADLEISKRGLDLTQRDNLLAFWTVRVAAEGGARWVDRAKQGERWTRGYTHIPGTFARLRTFLQNDCGAVGKHLDALFDERGSFDRSAAAGNLMQTLMLHAHKLPGCANASFMVRCANVMAYWMVAKSYGKASDKDYNQEKDGNSLIAQIVHGDMRDTGKPWTQPFWTKGNANQIAPAAAPEPLPKPSRPAHRPAGDQEKQIARLKRLLERRAFDGYGKLYYCTDDLAEYLNVSRRCAQNYLHILASGGAPQIERGQDAGPGGRAWLILLPAFWGANNSAETAKKVEKPAPNWGANENAEQPIETPQTADQTPQCKGDHQHPSAPPPAPAGAAEPGGASYDPRRDWSSGGRAGFTGHVRRFGHPLGDARMRPEPAPLADQHRFAGGHVPVPASVVLVRLLARRRRQPRPPGQQSFIGRDGVAAKYKRRKRHGDAPLPTPIPRPRARFVMLDEALPEVGPASPAPGAQASCGDPPPPAGGTPIGIVERLRAAKAEREAAHG
jgi:hypothetical protein